MERVRGIFHFRSNPCTFRELLLFVRFPLKSRLSIFQKKATNKLRVIFAPSPAFHHGTSDLQKSRHESRRCFLILRYRSFKSWKHRAPQKPRQFLENYSPSKEKPGQDVRLILKAMPPRTASASFLKRYDGGKDILLKTCSSRVCY